MILIFVGVRAIDETPEDLLMEELLSTDDTSMPLESTRRHHHGNNADSWK